VAKIIDGKKIAQEIKDKLKNHDRKCGLAVILIGNDAASEMYVGNKIKACAEVGITSHVHRLQGNISQDEVTSLINTLNNDQDINGILVQLPIPNHLNEPEILQSIAPTKDVDGFGALSPHVPCTARAVLELIKSTGVSLAGKHAVIIGRSNIVGKPTAQLLLNQDCTVTIAHSKTRDLKSITRMADILISAVGRKNLVTADMVKPGAIVIDVGISRQHDHTPSIVGDVDFESVKQIASHITPVPGGVGPMTVAMLLSNVLAQETPRL